MCNNSGVTTSQTLRLLRTTRKDKRISLAKIKKDARMGCSVVSLSRKLGGKQAITNEEIAKIARVLGLEVSVVSAAIDVRAPSAQVAA